jgi:hypothetical protein
MAEIDELTDPKTCKHLSFEAHVEVTRLADGFGEVGEVGEVVDKETAVITGYTADVRIKCIACGTPFEFIGLPWGLSRGKPMCSVDFQEARMPIRPATLAPIPTETKNVN